MDDDRGPVPQALAPAHGGGPPWEGPPAPAPTSLGQQVVLARFRTGLLTAGLWRGRDDAARRGRAADELRVHKTKELLHRGCPIRLDTAVKYVP